MTGIIVYNRPIWVEPLKWHYRYNEIWQMKTWQAPNVPSEIGYDIHRAKYHSENRSGAYVYFYCLSRACHQIGKFHLLRHAKLTAELLENG